MSLLEFLAAFLDAPKLSDISLKAELFWTLKSTIDFCSLYRWIFKSRLLFSAFSSISSNSLLLKNFQKNISKENIELFSSDLSAKLATITMNSQIRAKSYIKEIQFEDLKEQGRKNLIFYGRINGYSLDLIASGDYLKIKEIFEELEKKLTKEPVLLQEFKGDLKPFLSLSNHIDNIVHQFDQ